MSNSNDPKRPLVFDDDLAGTVFNTTDLNLKIEEQHRRNRERAKRSERSATANQSIELVSDPAQPNQSTTEPLTGASSSDSSKSASTPDLSKSANTSRKSGNKNALRHGGYFRGLLAWESQEEFEALRKGVREYWKPEGMFEEEAVLTLCQWMWNQRRVMLASEISYFRSPLAEQLKTGEVSLDDVIQHQCEVPEKVNALISEQMKLYEGLQKVSKRIGEHYYWTNTTEGKEIQLELCKMASEITTLAGQVREHAIDGPNKLSKTVEKITNLFDDAYQPEVIEKQARLASMIEREIDKSIKRLIFLKTFKAETTVPKIDVPVLASPPMTPSETPSAEEKAKPIEEASPKGIQTKPVAHAAPEHRGKPKAD
jgi:hypothetical protein